MISPQCRAADLPNTRDPIPHTWLGNLGQVRFWIKFWAGVWAVLAIVPLPTPDVPVPLSGHREVTQRYWQSIRFSESPTFSCHATHGVPTHHSPGCRCRHHGIDGSSCCRNPLPSRLQLLRLQNLSQDLDWRSCCLEDRSGCACDSAPSHPAVPRSKNEDRFDRVDLNWRLEIKSIGSRVESASAWASLLGHGLEPPQPPPPPPRVV